MAAQTRTPDNPALPAETPLRGGGVDSGSIYSQMPRSLNEPRRSLSNPTRCSFTFGCLVDEKLKRGTPNEIKKFDDDLNKNGQERHNEALPTSRQKYCSPCLEPRRFYFNFLIFLLFLIIYKCYFRKRIRRHYSEAIGTSRHN